MLGTAASQHGRAPSRAREELESRNNARRTKEERRRPKDGSREGRRWLVDASSTRHPSDSSVERE
jgi:hypothetical protein